MQTSNARAMDLHNVFEYLGSLRKGRIKKLTRNSPRSGSRFSSRIDVHRRQIYGFKPSAPVAQLDRVTPSEGVGRRFESCRVRHSRSMLGTTAPIFS